MKILLRTFLLFFCCLCCASGARALDPGRSLKQYQHKRWTREDGAPQPIAALAQTPDGYLWIGADTGLYRFDGVTFEPVDIGSSASIANNITSLFTSRSGDLWVAALNGRLVRIHRNRVEVLTPPGLVGPIWSLAEERSGAIWIRTGDFRKPIARYAGGRWTWMNEHFGLPIGMGNSGPAVASDGTVWLMNDNHLLFLRPGARKFEDSKRTVALYPGFATDARGRLWFSDAKLGTGLMPSPASDEQGMVAPLYPAVAKSAERYILFDREGSLWGTTQQGGIFRVRMTGSETGKEEVFTAADGLSADTSEPILEDREGNIWVGTANGLDRFRATNVVVETSIPSQSAYVVFTDSRGIVYIIAGDAVYRVRPGGVPEKIFHSPDTSPLCEGADGNVWISPDHLVSREGKVIKVATPAGRFHFLDCVQTRANGIWFSLLNHGFYRYFQRRWQHFSAEEAGIQPAYMVADREGRILVSQSRGNLERIDPPHRQLLWAAKDIPDADVRTLYQGKGDPIIGGGWGLARIHRDRVQMLRAHYSWLKGVEGLVETPEGQTWILGSEGLARVSSAALADAFDNPARRLDVLILNFRDGLPPTAPFYPKNSATRGGDGRLWFATNGALVWVDPAHLSQNSLPPSVTIRALVANGKHYRDPASVRLPSGSSNVEIDYTALSLSVPERVQFRYRLEGVDAGWVGPDARRNAFYTRLGPGTYRFTVIASNNDGVWNREGATLEFVIPPTFLQSNVFLLLCILVLGGAIWLLYSLRMKQVATRTRAGLEVKLAERERIARELHDTLLQGFQGLVLRFQSVANRLPKEEPLRPEMDQALDRAEAVLVEGRDRVRELRTATGDLTQHLIAIADNLAVDWPASFNLTIEGTPRALHPAVSDEIRQIGEEAIHNAFRHARARSIEVVLTYRTRELYLNLRDDGIGLPADVIATGGRDGHFGLVGLRERARRIGGTVTISSGANAGTEITLSVPGASAYIGKRLPWTWQKRLRKAKPEV